MCLLAQGGRAGVSLNDLHWYLQGVTVPYAPVEVASNFTCKVYNCVKALEETTESRLSVYLDDEVRRCRLNVVDPLVESAWFQTLNL